MFSIDHFLIPSVCFAGQSSKNVSSSPSIESLSGGREYSGSPPLSASKKESFFSTISHSRSHSRSINKKESVSITATCEDIYPSHQFVCTVFRQCKYCGAARCHPIMVLGTSHGSWPHLPLPACTPTILPAAHLIPSTTPPSYLFPALSMSPKPQHQMRLASMDKPSSVTTEVGSGLCGLAYLQRPS